MLTFKDAWLRRVIRVAVPFILVPLLVGVGAMATTADRYLMISLFVAVSALILFAAGFEQKQTGSRRLVLAAVMIALCVAGRMIPLVKPVAAITILSALYLGGEAGFLIGSLSALLSNMMFGQGPWTPFQMLGWGLVGLLAGWLSKPLLKSRVLLFLYAAVSGCIFSFAMDVWTVLWQTGVFDTSLYKAALITAVPHTLLYVGSNVVFVWLLEKPLGHKLARIKLKYGV